MHYAVKTQFLRRWFDVSFGFGVKLALMVIAGSILLKLTGVGVWAAEPWASVIFVPALGAISTFALLGGWFSIMTHDWEERT